MAGYSKHRLSNINRNGRLAAFYKLRMDPCKNRKVIKEIRQTWGLILHLGQILLGPNYPLHTYWCLNWNQVFILSVLLKIQWGRQEERNFEEKNQVNIQVVCSNSNLKHVLPLVGMNRWKQEICAKSAKSINSRVICYSLSLHKHVGEYGDQFSDAGLILK